MAPQMSIGGGLTFNPFSSAPAVSLQGIDIGDVIKTGSAHRVERPFCRATGTSPSVLRAAVAPGDRYRRCHQSGVASYLVVRPTANGSANELRRRSHVQSVLIRACLKFSGHRYWRPDQDGSAHRVEHPFCTATGTSPSVLRAAVAPGDRYRRCHQSGVASYLVVRPTANERRRRSHVQSVLIRACRESQRIDIGDLIKTVLPIVLSTLSAAPQGPRLQSSGCCRPRGSISRMSSKRCCLSS